MKLADLIASKLFHRLLDLLHRTRTYHYRYCQVFQERCFIASTHPCALPHSSQRRQPFNHLPFRHHAKPLAAPHTINFGSSRRSSLQDTEVPQQVCLPLWQYPCRHLYWNGVEGHRVDQWNTAHWSRRIDCSKVEMGEGRGAASGRGVGFQRVFQPSLKLWPVHRYCEITSPIYRTRSYTKGKGNA